MVRCRSMVISVLLLSLVCLPQLSAQTYTLTDLGAYVVPQAINRHGVVAGWIDFGVQGGVQVRHVCRWDTVNGLQDLGQWTDPSITPMAAAGYGLNNAGHIVGEQLFVRPPGITGQVAIDATETSGVTPLPQPTWLLGSQAMSNNGWLTGGSGLVDGGALAAVKWTPWQILRLPTHGGLNASVFAVNALGEFAGAADGPDRHSSATIWPRSNQPINLGIPVGLASSAYTINLWSETAGCSFPYAVHWDRQRVATLLPFIPGLNSGACVEGLNDHSFAVGWSFVEFGPFPPTDIAHAALWRPDHSVLDLNATISEPDWVLTNAYGINNTGLIVGIGTYQGVPHGWLLSPAAEVASQQ